MTNPYPEFRQGSIVQEDLILTLTLSPFMGQIWGLLKVLYVPVYPSPYLRPRLGLPAAGQEIDQGQMPDALDVAASACFRRSRFYK